MVYEKEVLFLSVLLLLSLSAYGQESKEIRGTVQDSLQHPLVGAQVRLISSKDTIMTSTGSQGRFSFPPVSTIAINLIVSHVGFQTQYRHYSLKNQSGKVDVGTVILPETATLLPEIIVRAIHPVEMKEDTIQYNAEAFSVPDGAVLEELMKRLPGIRVERDGTISIAGKEISKVQVNGQDFFGGKVQTATRNLLAEIVENVQVVEDYGEQARRTGIKSGEPQKILNINLQKNRNRGVFGQLAVGVGTEQRFLASGSVNFFREDQQFSLTSSLNNTNTNLGDVESTRGAVNDLTNGSDGITTVGSADVSYRDRWSDRLSGYGGYTYFGRQNSTRRITFQQSIFQDITLLNDQQENTDDKTDQHQFNYDLEYDNQSNYSFRISPRLSWGDSELSNLNRFTVSQTAMTDSLLTTGTTVSNNNTRSSEVGVNLFSVYHFKKARRSLTMQGSMGRYLNDDEQRTKTTDFSVQNQDTVGENTIDQRVWGERPTRQLTGQLAYVEPLGERALLELSYQLDYSSIARTQLAADQGSEQSVIIDSLSDRYQFRFATQRMSINYQLTQKKYNFTIGLAAQPYRLQGKSLSTYVRTDQSWFNLIPEARLFYQLTEGATLNFDYNALVHQPSFIQLQPVPDLSRPQYPVIGNPALEPTVSHRISLSFHRFNRTTGRTLLANVAVTPTQNEIVTNVIDRSERQEENATIVQETRFLNTYGAISMNGTYSYTIPLAQKKYTLSFNGLVNYSNNISYVNSRRNRAGNVLFNQGVAIGADFNHIWDAEVRVNYVTNQTAHAAAGTGASTHTFSLVCTGRYLPKNWEFGYDLGHTTNQGFGGRVQSNPTIFNVYAEYRFFKNDWMRIRCSGLDLFNQNVGIVRSVSGNTLADVRSNRLARYFLVSLTAHLRKM